MEIEDVRAPAPRGCRARPKTARRGSRADRFCASRAITLVVFGQTSMPVCRTHAKAYATWGDAAHANAETFWGWPLEVNAV